MAVASSMKPSESWLGFQLALPDFQKMLLILPRLQAVGIRAILDQQREVLAFLKRRCDQDLQLVDRIAKASEIKDIHDAVLTFYEGASKEYTAEAGKVVELGSHVASEAMRSIQRETEALIEPDASKKVA